MTLAATAIKLALAGVLVVSAAAPVKVSLSAPGHTPRINTHWNYTVRVTQSGKPVAAKISEQIVDPVGGMHPVQFGKNTKNITNIPIKGVFSDYIVWPASSRGIPLKLRVVVRVGGTSKIVTYAVTPRA
jgi:hypothetical protein